MRQDVPEHFAVACRLQFQVQVEIDDGEGRAFRQCGQSQADVGVDVLLAQLDEPAAGSKYLHAALNRFARKRIENDIDPVAVGDVEDLVGEFHVSGVADVLDAKSGQHFALGIRAGRRVDAGSDHLGDRNRGQPDTARGGMDQHAFAGGQPADFAQ